MESVSRLRMVHVQLTLSLRQLRPPQKRGDRRRPKIHRPCALPAHTQTKLIRPDERVVADVATPHAAEGAVKLSETIDTKGETSDSSSGADIKY